MTPAWLRALKRFFRAPATIVGALAVITLVGILGASLPQAGSATPAELARLRQHGPWFSTLVDGLALDHIFQSVGFLLALAVATISLTLVVAEQARRFRTAWSLEPAEGHFRTAPFQASFVRPSRGAEPGRRIRVRGRLGQAGSLLFHVGLLLVIAAAALRALFGVSAAVDLLEQEVLPPTVEAWGAQWPGPFARPFRLEAPLTLDQVRLSWYESGGIKDLRVQFTLAGSGPRSLGINEELRTSRGRLYVNSDIGPAALVEWSPDGKILLREALLMRQEAPGIFTAETGRDPILRARAVLGQGQDRPANLELRVTSGTTLRHVGRLDPGESVQLPGGGMVRLVGLPYWVRLHGSHDPGLWLVFGGFLVGLLGAALTYTVIRVDECVTITPEGGEERVDIALRPHRFAPLFRDRFERLVRHHGGQP